jgi:hypothetical protein
VELLDLNPGTKAYSTHFTRIIALFRITTDVNEFFGLNKSLQITQKISGSDTLSPDVETVTKHITLSCNAPHNISITFAHGHGLIYFEPMITGGESLQDIECLYCIAKKMHVEFGG